ncbi:mitochondrial inner membrane protease subunit 1 isoform X2 [Callithrix jacchus]|uniref:mitochondrial inner membrane protease subunit 1 isoform X2 n=1 Tax=Callithrix jacchus TaxID=9483 RepID=UPI0023DD22FE|nr:mitochondrial inner membrane protease subunit 1 isoform X2 [Callithrix jacchus]
MLRGVLGKTFRLVGYTIQYGCIAHCAFEYVGGVVMCSGPSMEPTIQNSDIVFAENLSRHFYGIQRGDIVIAKSPSDPKSNICKRVIGLEGDKILTTSPSNFFKSHSYTEFRSCYPGWSAMARIRLTATSAPWFQTILLPQPPE